MWIIWGLVAIAAVLATIAFSMVAAEAWRWWQLPRLFMAGAMALGSLGLVVFSVLQIIREGAGFS